MDDLMRPRQAPEDPKDLRGNRRESFANRRSTVLASLRNTVAERPLRAVQIHESTWASAPVLTSP
jgi:hypothetical protein